MVAASIRGDMQTTIKLAEHQLGDSLPLRILKALFLLKWVREFKATARNVAILLLDRPDLDIRAHEKAVSEALTLLESQSYLQRNGDTYEFLTDTEKDIEVEIKNTEIDESQVTDLLGKVLFGDVLRDPKIRYDANGLRGRFAVPEPALPAQTPSLKKGKNLTILSLWKVQSHATCCD